MPRPMPEVAPVARTTLPSKEKILCGDIVS